MSDLCENIIGRVIDAQPFAMQNDGRRIWQLFKDDVHVGDAIKAIAALLGDSLRQVPEWSARYFASGPQGEFFTPTREFAEALIAGMKYDRDDWTITDLSIGDTCRYSPDIDWQALYRFQTAMRYMDNNPKMTLSNAQKMADEDIEVLKRQVNPATPTSGDADYEAKYATPERLAKPAAMVKCDFCGASPGELHAFDCTALDEPNTAQAVAEPCGGCGEMDPAKRCIGCGHQFASETAMCAYSARYKFLRESGLEISWNAQVSFSPGYAGDADRMDAAIDAAIGSIAQAVAELPERNRSLVNSMVDRFLCWRLPDDFHPDSGVLFTPIDHQHMWPVGTNLLTAAQAKQMVEHMLAGAVPPATYSEAEGDAYTHGFVDGMDEADTKREPIGHLYRVAHSDEAAARPWASEGTVFVAGPAPVDGRRGAIQYVNVYTADSLARRGGSDG